MRIVYVGNFGPPYSTENDVREALGLLGHEVIALQENAASYSEVRRQALTSDLLLWTGTWDEAQPYDETAITMSECYDRGVPTATYHLDTFHGLARGGRQWWRHPMFLAEWVFTADGDHEDEWAQHGVDKHVWLPPGVRDSACYFGDPLIDYRCDVAFVGSSGVLDSYHPEWPYRAELVGELRRMCARRGWSFMNPGGEPDQPNWGKVDRGDDLNRFYATAKVTVGDSLCFAKERSRYWSDRVYEATGRGGLLIMPEIYALNLNDQFDGALPIYLWGDFVGLERTIERMLADPHTRLTVRKDCQAITAERHTYSARMRTLLEVVGL